MNEDILTDLGLSTNEAKIYTSLLSLGLTTITSIAHESKLHRSNVYDSIKKLVEKGLVAYIIKDNVTYYEATDPQALLRILKEKENRLKAVLPQLMLSKKLAQSKGEAHIYEGVPAFTRLLYEFLQYKDPILAYGIPPIAPELMKTKIMHFHKERMALKIPMKHIYNHNAQERIVFLNKMKLTYARYLPESFDSQVSTNICGEEVLLTLWIKPVLTIQIKNKLVADSYKKYFDLLWAAAKAD
ncbi:MAG: helix-turn-helix domain-containing protein [Nanoarchaeota archaeon]|nr:helix-turn-helix domain-containing protein [Nanoarchaeota archaeon]MBU1854321.1 helix-turn-helix domain-containing protein [Nanoarchaeota archaeon]